MPDYRDRSEKSQRMVDLLEKIPIPKKSIDVYGGTVSIHCFSYRAADQWAAMLSNFCRASPPRITKTTRRNKVNKGTCLLPTRHEIHLVTARFA